VEDWNYPENVSIGEQLDIGTRAFGVRGQDPVGEILFIEESYVRLPQRVGRYSDDVDVVVLRRIPSQAVISPGEFEPHGHIQHS